MENQKNILSMDFSSNADLKALVSGWEVGKTYNLSLRLQLNEMNEDGAKFGIKEVNYEEPEEAIKPDSSEPVLMVMSEGADSGKEPYVAP